MKLQQLDPRKVLTPDVRVNSYYREDQEELLKSSLAVMGQQEAILVLQTGGEYYVVDGMHRLQEAVRRGDPTIAAVVTEGRERDVYLRNLVTSTLHGRPKASEVVRVIKHLMETQNMGVEELVRETGLTQDFIERMMTIAQAPEFLVQGLDEELVGVQAAYEIARLHNEEMQTIVYGQQVVYRWSLKDLKNHIKGVLAAANAPPASLAPPHVASTAPVAEDAPATKCSFCHQEQDPLHVVVAPICVECSGALLTALRAQGAAP